MTETAVSGDLKRLISKYDLGSAPGHLIRRAQQRAVEFYVAEVGEDGPTPQQFAVLLNVFQNPGMSQTDLVQASAIDRSTLAEILRRMVARELVSRTRRPGDQRAYALSLTTDGLRMLEHAFAAALRAQRRILEPVPPAERPAAMAILATIAGFGGGDAGSGALPADDSAGKSAGDDA